MNPFTTYAIVLKTINQFHPQNGFELIKQLQENPEIKSFLTQNSYDHEVTSDFAKDCIDIAIEQIQSGLVKGTVVNTKMGSLVSIERLTVNGHQYLSSLEKPSLLKEAKQILVEDGLPMTPTSISKAVAKLLFR